jgi:hypothetical protein
MRQLPGWLQVIFKNALSTSATATYKELLRVVRVIKRMLLATGAGTQAHEDRAPTTCCASAFHMWTAAHFLWMPSVACAQLDPTGCS